MVPFGAKFVNGTTSNSIAAAAEGSAAAYVSLTFGGSDFAQCLPTGGGGGRSFLQPLPALYAANVKLRRRCIHQYSVTQKAEFGANIC